MAKYQRKIDNIDPERGDALVLRREDLLPLFADGIPRDTTKAMLYGLGLWFVGGEEPTHSDPFANAYLRNLVAHQKEYVFRYIEGCKAKSPKNMGEVDISQLHPTQGDIRQTIKESKQKEVNEVKRKFTSTSGGVAQPSAAPPLATDGETITYRGKTYKPEQVLKILAPKDYFGHVDSPKEDEEYFNSSFAKADNEEIRRFLDDNLYGEIPNNELGVAEDASAQAITEAEDKARAYLKSSTTQAMLNFRREYGADVLGRLMWRIDCELWKRHGDDYPSATKVAAAIDTQLQAIATALDIMRRRAK